PAPRGILSIYSNTPRNPGSKAPREQGATGIGHGRSPTVGPKKSDRNRFVDNREVAKGAVTHCGEAVAFPLPPCRLCGSPPSRGHGQASWTHRYVAREFRLFAR